MIESLLIKEHLGFKEVDIEFEKGLVVFSGASGAGKSVLMRSFLSLFGFTDSVATLIDASLDAELNLEEIGIESESPNVVRCAKQKSVRYFINSQLVSKKSLSSTCSGVVRYLSAKESGEFENEKLLELLDGFVQDGEFESTKAEYRTKFKKYKEVKSALHVLSDEEKRVEELKEFARFEIAKIEEINPKIGEDEELMRYKKMLSKKDKLESALSRANAIFEYEGAVSEALSIAEVDGEFFSNSMNELRVLLDGASEHLEELEGVDIEAILERIEKISSLKSRYGQIDEILEHLRVKKEELLRYENISFEKKELENEYKILESECQKMAKLISTCRGKALPKLENKINMTLKELFLDGIEFSLDKISMQEYGIDELKFHLNRVELKSVSSGELNRIRLAFIACYQEILNQGKGVLILDEIDANLSGKEAMSIGRVLKRIASAYQVFAISHQPQLSSCANQHFLVEKVNGVSFVKELNQEDRVVELARMVSGEEISKEALELAGTLLNRE